MDEVEWLTEREERAWRGLQLMHMHLDREMSRQLASDSDLSLQDYGVLVALTDVEGGRLRLFELGEMLGWEKSRLSHHVARMARRGLVTKERCDADRRGSYVALTTEGRQAIEIAAPGHVAAARDHFIDRLTPQQLDALAAIADAVLEDAPTARPSDA